MVALVGGIGGGAEAYYDVAETTILTIVDGPMPLERAMTEAEPLFAGAGMERGGHAMGGEDDRLLAGLGERVDGVDPELAHLLDHPLVVHHLSEDRAPMPLAGELLDLPVGDAHPGTEAVLRRPFDVHTGPDCSKRTTARGGPLPVRCRAAETGCTPQGVRVSTKSARLRWTRISIGVAAGSSASQRSSRPFQVRRSGRERPRIE